MECRQILYCTKTIIFIKRNNTQNGYKINRKPIIQFTASRYVNNMLIIHATQKLLNTAGLPAIAYVTKPGDGQLLHSWYATTFSSSFPGKMMTVYIHEPSMIAVVCKGKTIRHTWPQFLQRLPMLLQRCGFPAAILESELLMCSDFVVAKTSNRSMLGYMNQVIFDLEHNCRRFASWEEISETWLQNIVLNSLFGTKEPKRKYFSPLDYWKEELANL